MYTNTKGSLANTTPIEVIFNKLKKDPGADVRYDIQHCEDINKQDGDGNTLLHLSQNTKVVKELIRLGAGHDIDNKKYEFPYHMAVHQKNYKKLKALIDIKEVAMRPGLPEHIRKYPQSDVDWNSNPSFNSDDTALRVAVLNNDLKAAKMLLDAGAGPSGANGRIDDVYLMECSENPEMIQLLYRYGGEATYNDEDEWIGKFGHLLK